MRARSGSVTWSTQATRALNACGLPRRRQRRPVASAADKLSCLQPCPELPFLIRWSQVRVLPGTSPRASPPLPSAAARCTWRIRIDGHVSSHHLRRSRGVGARVGGGGGGAAGGRSRKARGCVGGGGGDDGVGRSRKARRCFGGGRAAGVAGSRRARRRGTGGVRPRCLGRRCSGRRSPGCRRWRRSRPVSPRQFDPGLPRRSPRSGGWDSGHRCSWRCLGYCSPCSGSCSDRSSRSRRYCSSSIRCCSPSLPSS